MKFSRTGNRLIWCMCGLLLLFAITACSSGGEGGSSNSNPTAGVAVNGTAAGPGGAVALAAPSSKSWLTSLFEIAEAYAQQVTGWTPIPGATVRVFRIDNNGDPLGTTLTSPATTAADGSFSLTLPTGTALDSTLVVQIENDPGINGPVAVGTANTYSALLVQTTVALNPAIEVATQAIVNDPAPLTNFSNAEVTQIVDGISNLVAQNPPGPSVTTNMITTNFSAAIANAINATSAVTGTAPAILTTALPNGVEGSSYSVTLSAVGGTGTLAWSLQAETLPAGLTLNPTTGVISGTPTAQGVLNFTVRVQDSLNPTPQSAAQALSISIVAVPLVITTTTLPAGTVNVAYSHTLTATGGTAPLTWSLVTGSNPLPAGLSLSAAGLISGIPTAVGTTTIAVQVQDAGSPLQTTTKQLSLTINPPGPPPPVITTTSPLPVGIVGQSYSRTLGAINGTPPYSWSLVPGTGNLPTGLSLSTAGVISGTPTAQGTANFTVQVLDSGSPQQSATKQFSLTINAAGAFNYGGTLTLTNAPAASGTTFVVGTPFTHLNDGSRAGTCWEEQTGTTSEGLCANYNFATGQIDNLNYAVTDSSNPGAWAFFDCGPSFTQPCSNAALNATTGTLTLTNTVLSSVAQPPFPSVTLNGTLTFSPVIITTMFLPSGIVGQAYNQPLVAIGGTLPYTWFLAPGSQPLPGGLNLSTNGPSGSSFGVVPPGVGAITISGTPTTAGLFGNEDTTGDILFRVQDSAAHFYDADLNMIIHPAGTTSVPNSRVLMSPYGIISAATAFYDGQGRLIGTDSATTSVNFPVSVGRVTLVSTDVFSAPNQIVRMSRWAGPGEGEGFPLFNANQGSHNISGIPTAFTSLPATGQTVYNVIASTHPTIVDGSLAPGTGVTGTVTVNWVSKTVSFNLTVNGPTGPLLFQSGSTGTVASDGTISIFAPMQGLSLNSDVAQGSFYGTEAIPQYLGLSLTLSLAGNSAPMPLQVHGAVVLQKQ